MPNPQGITERVFRSPARYVQGPTAFNNAATYLRPLGSKPVLICDDTVFEIAGQDLLAALNASDLLTTRVAFGGEASLEEVDRLTECARAHSADSIVALGGGKTLDCGKLVAHALRVPLAVLPTLASTDAPCAAVAVLYTPAGAYAGYRVLPRGPDLVLVDTGVVSRAPPRFLAAGMGDALATHVEARRTRNTPNAGGGLPLRVADAVARACEETLFAYGRQAYVANRAQVVTPALEAVVEANTLLSGLGWESGGVAAAHSVHNALTNLPELHHWMHGEKVAFGVVCQLVLDGVPQVELDRYIGLMLSVGLPISFELLGIPDVKEETVRDLARWATAEGETIWFMDALITEDAVYGAIVGADAMVNDYIRRTGWKKEV